MPVIFMIVQYLSFPSFCFAFAFVMQNHLRLDITANVNAHVRVVRVNCSVNKTIIDLIAVIITFEKSLKEIVQHSKCLDPSHEEKKM